MAPANPKPRMSLHPPFTVEVVGAERVNGESIPRRNITTAGELRWQPEEGIETVFDIVKYSARKYGDKKALGSRRLIEKHIETKKVNKVVDGKVTEVDKSWTYFEMGGYEYASYNEHMKLVLELGSALRSLGLNPREDKVHFFASTSKNWLALAHGAMSQSMPIVTAYDTLGAEGLKHSLLATKAKLIFLEPHLLKTFISALDKTSSLAAKCHIETTVYNTDSDHEIAQADLDILQKYHGGLRIMSFAELRDLGRENATEPVEPKGSDLACVMYTSGSTGVPKGVKLTHGNVVAAVAGVQTQLGSSLHGGIEGNDTVLAYLPLAHIFEFVIEQIALYFGVVLGYGSPRTLSDTSMRNSKGDIREFQPSILIGVPAVWEMVKKGIVARIDSGSALLRGTFWGAFYAKQFLMHNHLPGSAILDAAVFGKVKDATGGRLRLCVTAAAPIARDTQEFISMAIAPVVNAYGMTETCGMGAICHPDAWTVDATGAPESCVELKLVDYAEAGYFSSGGEREQGEIWIRGPSVMAGYWRAEGEAAKDTDEEWKGEGGWFKTGDIGEWDGMGHLRIIDRKKNLVKTLNGEYIALEKLEAIYRAVPVVANICVYASIAESHPVAMVVPAEPALLKLATSLGVEGHGIGDLVHNEAIQGEVLRQLQAVGKKAGFAGIEIIVGVVLADEEWTPVNGLVTATNKVNRRALFEKYEGEIKAAYGDRS